MIVKIRTNIVNYLLYFFESFWCYFWELTSDTFVYLKQCFDRVVRQVHVFYGAVGLWWFWYRLRGLLGPVGPECRCGGVGGTRGSSGRDPRGGGRGSREGGLRSRRENAWKSKIRFTLGRGVVFSCFLISSEAGVWPPYFAFFWCIAHPLLFNISSNFFFLMILFGI